MQSVFRRGCGFFPQSARHGARVLALYLRSGLVDSETIVPGVANEPRGTPLTKGNFAHDFRAHPMGVGVSNRDIFEATVSVVEPQEPFQKAGTRLSLETGENLSDEVKASFLEHANEQ